MIQNPYDSELSLQSVEVKGNISGNKLHKKIYLIIEYKNCN